MTFAVSTVIICLRHPLIFYFDILGRCFGNWESYAFRVNRLRPDALGKFATLSNYDAATIRREYVL
jgi:hypothetical protein